MMTFSQNRRGSALLVVLGMLAFMLFSGLAFSVYMRQSRLPTSFLRRTTTTRQLAKAALAEAIEEIDKAVGNDPHPGLRRAGKSFDEDSSDNFWSHRVFIGRGTSSSKENASEPPAEGSLRPAYASLDDTVPVLTLEGLAYLPPNLINEARYYFQRTPTAKWKSFWFDSGRYAYAAVDVSDYFDVNRLFADRPRMACGPRRITLAHLFEQVQAEEGTVCHVGPGSGAAKWDQFMEQFRSVDDDDNITFTGGKCPFVSLADFNMAWGSRSMTFGSQSVQNPFYSFVMNNGIPYQCGESATDETADKYRMMTFVTDGWFPIPEATKNASLCNLEEARYQPYRREALEQVGFRPSVRELSTTHPYSDSQMLKWFNGPQGQRLTVPDCIALWDYLDIDSAPVSLCMPTVERTPMVCGLRPTIAANVKLDVEGQKASETLAQGKVELSDGYKWDFYTCEYTYSLSVAGLTGAQKGVQVLLAYPFREHDMADKLGRNFDVDGRLSIFLTRDDGKDITIRPSKFAAYPTKDTITRSELTDKALFSFPIMPKTVTPQIIVEANRDFPCYKLDMNVDSEFSGGGDLVLAKVKYTWPRDRYGKDSDGNDLPTPTRVNDNPVLDESQSGTLGYQKTTVDSVSGFSVYPLTSDGERMADKDLENILKERKSLNLKANVAVWIRVRSKEDNDLAVDFVPACHLDDQNVNGDSMDTFAQEFGGDSYGYPLLRFVATSDNGNALAYSLNALHGTSGTSGSLGAFTLPDTKLLVSDPRYNYAPENWVRPSGGAAATGELRPEDWATQAMSDASGQGRDGDVYMFTSDAGYMQSIYELAFLPRMSNGFNDNDFDSGRLRYGAMSTTFGRNDYANSFGDAKDHNCMWRTYSPFDDENDFYDLEAIMASGSGTKVNPYSDSTKVLMAAFANTPHDWRAASTNNDELFGLDVSTFNGKHAWNAYSSDETGKICWDCLEEFAEKFKSSVRSERNWEDAFANMDWSRDKRRLLDSGEELDGDDSDLYSVDKKFFYGFWRDCFAARQQLFLIFVRAEPMMMGGGVTGHTPPQLGARAVALVWRDPTRTQASQNEGGSAQTYAPHRSRILFYHQFD